jgi:hypothetical protein
MATALNMYAANLKDVRKWHGQRRNVYRILMRKRRGKRHKEDLGLGAE